MLVLTRKPGQKILIGDDIVVQVVDVQGDNVKIAVEAPKQIKIYREELYAAIIRENKEAVQSFKEDLRLPELPKKS